MTMKIKSIRFDREFEVETVKAGKDAVNPEDILVVRFASLKAILNELGEAVKLTTEPCIVPPVVCVKATIQDDTGTEVTAFGSVNINMETPIPKKFPVETALSRAVSNAVIEYCQFEGRVYSDVAIPPTDEVTTEKPTTQTAQTPVRQTVPNKVSTKPVTKTSAVVADDEMPDGAPEAPKPVAKKTQAKAAEKTSDNLGDYVIPIGNEYTKGKKLSTLSQKSLDWLCNLKASNDAAKEAQAKAKAYVEQKAAK